MLIVILRIISLTIKTRINYEEDEEMLMGIVLCTIGAVVQHSGLNIYNIFPGIVYAGNKTEENKQQFRFHDE